MAKAKKESKKAKKPTEKSAKKEGVKKSTSKTKTSAKSTKKGDTKTKKVESKESITKSENKESSTKKSKKKPNYKFLGLIVVVGLVVMGLLAIRNQLFVATVNGKPVTRWELVRELEKQGGEQVLQTLVLKKLIAQEAVKNGVSVSDEEMQDELDKVSETLPEGLTLEDALASQGQSIEQYKDRLYWDLLLGKMVEQRVEVTDEEVNQYYEDNKDFLAPEGEEVNEQEIKEQVKEDLRNQKVQMEIGEYVEELRSNGNVTYYMFVVQQPEPAEATQE